MRAFLADFHGEPLIQRWATVGVIVGLGMGGVGGLIRGLEVNPATSWFAVIELGPVAIVGGLVGLCCGLIVTAGRWIKRRGSPPA